jgi:hypothetical protein
MKYLSKKTAESMVEAGVRFVVRRASLGRRIELTKLVHELSQRVEFLRAGAGEREQIEAAWLMQEIDSVYLRWGLEAVEGLEIDGEPATVDSLVDLGPEKLAQEALAAVKAEAGLSEAERKNF